MFSFNKPAKPQIGKTQADANTRSKPDAETVAIADYIANFTVSSDEAYHTARLCLMDAIGCGVLALNFPECASLLGPIVDDTKVPNGARVFGTNYVLDPFKAAFDMGTIIRWLDFNDTWLAQEWGHPSDNLGSILAIADYVSQKKQKAGEQPLTMHDVLTALIKAYEIQGVIALENSFNKVGLDHVILVKLASTAVATQLLGGSKDDIINAVSQVWVDGHALRAYRHAPNTGPRKSWAAGDATSRAVGLALLTMAGQPGYPSALSASHWGFYDVSFHKQRLKLLQPYGSYVVENILFKISYPAEFHAQTAVEAACILHEEVKTRLNDIAEIRILTQEPAVRIISKEGPLYNSADRDHCLQYMVAIGLIHGTLKAKHYSDDFAQDKRIDELRQKMVVAENINFSRDYLDPDKRSIANQIQITFKDGSKTEDVLVEYPLGHKKRREEGMEKLINKFKENMLTQYPEAKVYEILTILQQHERLVSMSVPHFMEMLHKSN